jgi:rRNA maturation endonuclease Nob1
MQAAMIADGTDHDNQSTRTANDKDTGVSCWRCGRIVAPGSVCAICGAVNKLKVEIPRGGQESKTSVSFR